MSITTISFHSSQAPPLPMHRFTVEEYHRLGELGLLTPENRVELLEGWIVEKMNQRPVHGYVVGVLTQWFHDHLADGWIVRCQLPITLETSEPEPDLAVVRGLHTDYRQRHPGGTDCRLLIEVADTSLAKDRAKAAIYASAGIAEYWIVNLIDNVLQRMRQPDGNSYAEAVTLTASDSIETEIGGKMLRLELKQLFDDK